MKLREPEGETKEASVFSWPGDRQWILVDALTTSVSVTLEGEIDEAIVTGVDRIARICCDVGIPHIVIGEGTDSLALLTGTLLAPAISLSSDWPPGVMEHFERAWAAGCSCSWSISWERFSVTGLPHQLGELLSQRMPQVLLYGGADARRFSAIAKAFRAVSSSIWIVDDLVRHEVLDEVAMPTVQLATVEHAYSDWSK